jgi:hypothetical protein
LSINSKKYKYIGQQFENYGLISYLSLGEEFLINKKSETLILVTSNNQNVTMWSEPFYLKNDHSATSILRNPNINKYSALFVMSLIKKQMTKFDYNNKVTNEKLKDIEIELPFINADKPDFNYMETYIKIQQKLAIADVARWTQKQITATKHVIAS